MAAELKALPTKPVDAKVLRKNMEDILESYNITVNPKIGKLNFGDGYFGEGSPARPK